MKSGTLFCVAGAVLFGLVPPALQYLLIHGVSKTAALLGPNALLLAGALLLCLNRRSTLHVPFSSAAALVLCGALGMGATGLFLASSYAYISTGTATVINFLYPSIVTVASAILLRQKLTAGAAAAMFFSVAGMILISLHGSASDGMPQHSAMTGYFLALCSAFTYSLYILGTKIFRCEQLSDAGELFYLSAGALLTALLWMLTGHEAVLPLNGHVVSVFLAYCVMIGGAFVFISVGITKIGPVRASYATLFEPVTAVACSVAFYGDRLPASALAGFALIFLSVWFSSR
jgi:drug/metabolite transporter (DMT)-like permease